MLELSYTSATLLDDENSNIRYKLPIALQPLTNTDGLPQALITRTNKSGMLLLRLGAVWPVIGTNELITPFSGGQFRLFLHTPSGNESGRWHPIYPDDNELINSSIKLDLIEATIARRLGLTSSDIVDIEVELYITGRLPVYPWLVRADYRIIRQRLAALLDNIPASQEELTNAFLGLDSTLFEWHALETGTIPLPHDEALQIIAHYAKDLLFNQTNNGWEFKTETPQEHIDISLNTARIGKRIHTLTWSFSEFLANQASPDKHLIDVTTPAPFEAAKIRIINNLPLHKNGIRKISIEVQTGGPSGRLKYSFEPGTESIASLDFIRETFDDLSIKWRARITVLTSSGPRIVETDWSKSDMHIEIDNKSTGLYALKFSAVQSVFTHISEIILRIGSRTIILNQDKNEGWAVGSKVPDSLPVSVKLTTGETVKAGVMHPDKHGLTITESDIGAGEVIPVSIKTTTDSFFHNAYVAVQVKGAHWHTMEQDTVLSHPVRQINRFILPDIEYRVRHVKKDVNGKTHIMTETHWQIESGKTINIEIQ